MNVKVNITALHRLLSNHISMAQVYSQLAPLTAKYGIQLAELKTGTNYLQWTLPDNGWTKFSELDEASKASAATEYEVRIHKILTETKLPDNVLTIPSDAEFVYFKSNGMAWDIALVAWGYRYTDKPNGKELETWKSKLKLQEVSIGFQWDGNLIPNLPFTLAGQPRVTDEAGWFHVDGKLPVGKQFELMLHEDKGYALLVTEGKARYVYDITQYFHAVVCAEKDEAPLVNSNITLQFGEWTKSVTTDEKGHARIQIPLKYDANGQILPLQPACAVQCQDEKQIKEPTCADEELQFYFSFQTKVPEPDVDVFHVPEEPEPPVTPPVTPPVKPTEEPEVVTITILDYEGYPVIDMPVVLKTKKKGEIHVKTDDNGVCSIPKDWLLPKEKITVKFVVTPEYQETHDIHYIKKTNK
jgi:hypothetical protein